VTLRITSEDQLDSLPASTRKQLEQKMAGVDVSKGKRARPEQAAGRCLVQWVDQVVIQHPDLGRIRVGEYFAHIPNGGARSAIEAAIFKGQGVRPGWPDYTLDIPIGRYHGFRLELKAAGGDKPDQAQLDILRRLELAGYCVAVSWGFDDARRAIESYLALAR